MEFTNVLFYKVDVDDNDVSFLCSFIDSCL